MTVETRVHQARPAGREAARWMLRALPLCLLACGMLLAAPAWAADWWADIANDRVEDVRNQLALGEDPNARTKDGQPALMQAIRDGAWKTYDLLAAHKRIDVNATNRNDETPLMYLAVVGETERAKKLIGKGAQVNRLGWTPLHYGASRGHLEMVRMLIKNKAMVNAPASDGTTPLMMAAYAGSEPVVRALLAAGADVTARNLAGQDAAAWARLKQHDNLAGKLDDLTRRVMRDRANARARQRAADAAAAAAAAAASAAAAAQASESAPVGLPPATSSALPPAVPPGPMSAPVPAPMPAPVPAPAPVVPLQAQGSVPGAAASPQPSPAPQLGGDNSGTSRYFDLKRFEQPQEPGASR